ncbi:MAG: ATP-dependent DNA helicase RecG [Porticoccaceae bacterium]
MTSPRIGVPDLERPVDQLRGVGPKLQVLLKKAGIYQIKDLLFRLPLRYLDRTRITPIGSLQPNQYVLIQGEILASDVLFGRRRSLMVKLGDSTGVTTLRFFHFSQAQKAGLGRGKFLRCAGEVRPGKAGLELYHPEYEFVQEDAPPPAAEFTPVYSTTEGLTQGRLRDLSTQALQVLEKSPIEELVKEGPGKELPLRQALLYLHRPPVDAPVNMLLTGQHPYQKKIVFEELVAHQLSMLLARNRSKAKQAPILRAKAEDLEGFFNQLPFSPTASQRRVTAEIEADMQTGHPMLRLLQGDVGSGKTLVAAASVLAAMGSGFQAAVMAPTEILAEQHLEKFEAWLQSLGYKVIFLSSKIKGKARETVLELISSGEANLIIGTHALIQGDVEFANLGLMVIDEQHRFGVKQRLELRQKGSSPDCVPHQLIMTATPIPRTLAMSHYADLDTSIIDELPPGRTPVVTAALPGLRRAEVIERVNAACTAGRQAYWVCTLIEESEELQAQAAEATADELSIVLGDWNIGLIHGRMKPSDKQRVMREFHQGSIQVLVATTVIEVGVDVPNASLMIIENPERLGLSQLHQLRGRVGRGSTESHCLLLFEAPLSENSTARIRAMRETNDGFKIADIDLKLRGPGELLGSRQAGEQGFLMADLSRDSALLPLAHDHAKALFRDDPDRVSRLLQRWLPDSIKYLDA